MENHNKKETVVVDYKPSDVRIGRFPILHNSPLAGKSALNSNRYLSHQVSRIANALNEGKVEKAVLIGMSLIKISRSYQILCYLKCRKQGYVKEDASKIRKEVIRTMNQCRAFNLTMDLKRFYIQKPNGKFRPIGAPTVGSKVISKMLTDMWVTISEKKRSDMQHAFRPNKGVGSAIEAVIRKIDNKAPGDVIIEFDLKGFFNTIKRHSVHEAALRFSKLLANCVRHIMDNTRYVYDELRTESELIKVDLKHGRDKSKDVIYRSGMPQGLPLSPLGSTISLENVINMEELVLYADDGILVGGEDKFKEFVRKAINIGAEIAPEKTQIIGDTVKFLGVTLDIKNRLVITDDSGISWDDKGLKQGLKRHAQQYSKIPESWDGEVDEGSFIKKHELHLGDIGLWNGVMVKLSKDGVYKGYKHTKSGGIYYVSESSSLCGDDLLKESVAYDLKKILPFHGKFSKPAESHKMNRYIELGNDGDGGYNANKMNGNLHTIGGNLHN